MQCLVVGGNGTIGGAWVAELRRRFPGASIRATWSRSAPEEPVQEGVQWSQLDPGDSTACHRLASEMESLDILINAVGFLHDRARGPEKSIRQLDADFFLHNMRVNALPTLLLAQAFQGALKKADRSWFATVSAKVGSIEDNRLGGWYSYRASKAALNMAIKTLSLEWQRSVPRCCVAALHPGTVISPLSEPFRGRTPPEKQFTPEYSVACQAEVLLSKEASESGGFWSWNGERLPW